MIIMNTVWLKIVAAVVLLVVIFVIISKIANKTSKPVEPDKTIADTWREDEKRLRAEPNVRRRRIKCACSAGKQLLLSRRSSKK